MHDNDPQVLELEKQRNLSKTQHRTSTPHAEAPGWNEHLASASEASVKADRHGPNQPSTVMELQKKTVEYIRGRHSPEDEGNTSRDSRDEILGPLSQPSKDEVSGPLSSAEGVEDSDMPQLVKRTVKEKTEVFTAPKTSSEQSVKADRGEI